MTAEAKEDAARNRDFHGDNLKLATLSDLGGMESGTHDGGIVMVPRLLQVQSKMPQIPQGAIATSSGSSADSHLRAASTT